MTDITENEVETVDATQNTESVNEKAVDKTPSDADPDVNENVVEEKELSVDEKIAKAVKEAEERVKGATQKRIDRLTYEARSKEEELRKYQSELDQYKPKEDLPPSEDNFDTYEEWQDAVIEFKANQKLKQIESETRQRQMQQKQQEAIEAGRKRFEAMESEFKQSNPEYDLNAKKFMDISQEVVATKGNNPTVQAIGQVLTEIDAAPALINHLGQNEELVFELANKTPVQAAFELFKISQSLTETKQINKTLPEPVKPVSATGKTTKSLKELSGAELLAKYAK